MGAGELTLEQLGAAGAGGLLEQTAHDHGLADEALADLAGGLGVDEGRGGHVVDELDEVRVVGEVDVYDVVGGPFQHQDQQLAELVVQDVVEGVVKEQVEQVPLQASVADRRVHEVGVGAVQPQPDVNRLQHLVDLRVEPPHLG